MIQDLKPLIKKLTVFAKDNLKFEHPPRLFLKKDVENSKCALGKTAHYDPQNSSITLFISNRHPKDILRSYAHELVHHCQNERGDLSPEKMKTMTKNYAQENDHMRKMEQEAYLLGNMCFRDWEDGLDDKLQYKMQIAEQKYLKENKKMSVKLTKQFLKETIERLLNERVKRDSEDRVTGRRAGGRRVKPLEEQGKEYNNALQFSQTQLKQIIKAYEKGGPAGMRKKAEEISRAVTNKQNGDPDQIKSNARKLVTKAKEDHKKKYDDAVAAYKNRNSKKSDTAVADPEKQPKSTNEGTYVTHADAKKKPKVEKPEKPVQKEDNGAFSDSHYCIHHGGVQHEGRIVAAEAIRHVEPDQFGFISHYDMMLEDGTILEDVAASEIQVTNASLAEVHRPKAEDGHKPMKKAPVKEEEDTNKVNTPEKEEALYENRFSRRNTNLFEKLLKEWTK